MESAVLPIIVSLAGLAGALLAASRSIDARFAAQKASLEKEVRDVWTEIGMLKAGQQVNDARDLTHLEHIEYRIHANTELIQHRTARFKEEITRVETLLGKDIQEIKGFLAKTSNFIIRNRGNDEA